LKNRGPTLAVAYLVAVLALTFAAFDLRGDIRPVWTLALMAATLPFSAVAWLGLYSLVHGAGLTCFAFYFLIRGHRGAPGRAPPPRAALSLASAAIKR
jgi:hypothetical protein